MLHRHGTLLSIKLARSDQHLSLEMGESRIQFVRRANEIKRRANADGRSREKTDRCLRPIRQEKRYAILLPNAEGTEHMGVLPDFSVQPRIGARVPAPTGRMQQDYSRRDQRSNATRSNDDRPSLSGPLEFSRELALAATWPAEPVAVFSWTPWRRWR